MKKLLILLVLLTSIVGQAQNDGRERKGLVFSLAQDGRLLFFGDDKGNDPLTTNLMMNFEMRGKVKGKGFFQGQFLVSPTLEYADLKGGHYHRYGLNVGYNFTNWLEIPEFWFIRDEIPIDVTLYGGAGYISRKMPTGGETTFGYSFVIGSKFSVEIIDNLNFIIIGQLTDRKDLKQMWGNQPYFMINGYGGLEFQF